MQLIIPVTGSRIPTVESPTLTILKLGRKFDDGVTYYQANNGTLTLDNTGIIIGTGQTDRSLLVQVDETVFLDIDYNIVRDVNNENIIVTKE